MSQTVALLYGVNTTCLSRALDSFLTHTPWLPVIVATPTESGSNSSSSNGIAGSSVLSYRNVLKHLELEDGVGRG
jgi:hypothetical protein